MKSILTVFLFLLLNFLLLSSCREDNNNNFLDSLIDIDLPEYDNIPVIANVENSFVYTLNANKFSYNFAEFVDFNITNICFLQKHFNVTSINLSTKEICDGWIN